MSIKAYVEKINELEERIEELERNHKGFVSTTMIILSYLHPDKPELIKARKLNLERLELLLPDRDFDFEKEKIIQNFLKEMRGFI